MYPVFESIRIQDGRAVNLSGHIARMERTARSLWKEAIDYHGLPDRLGKLPSDGLHKCRVDYFREELRVNIQPYTVQVLTRLYVVEENDLQYQFKWSDRSVFDHYRRQIAPQEDILFVQNGLLTDSLYANLMLWNGEEWHTPEQPLLPGTRRQLLIDEGTIIPRSISVGELRQYARISLISAMLNPGDREADTEQISHAAVLRKW